MFKNIYAKSCSASKTQPGQGEQKKWSGKKRIRAALGWQEGDEPYVAGPSVFLLGLTREGAHYVRLGNLRCFQMVLGSVK